MGTVRTKPADPGRTNQGAGAQTTQPKGTIINGKNYKYLNLDENTQATIQKLIEQGRTAEVESILNKYNVYYEDRPGDSWNRFWGNATSSDIQREADLRDINDALLQLISTSREERANSALSQTQQMKEAGYNTDLTGGITPGEASEFNEPEAGTPLLNQDSDFKGRTMETVQKVATLTMNVMSMGSTVYNTLAGIGMDSLNMFEKGLKMAGDNPGLFFQWDESGRVPMINETSLEFMSPFMGRRRYNSFRNGVDQALNSMKTEMEGYKNGDEYLKSRAKFGVTRKTWMGTMDSFFTIVSNGLANYENEMAKYQGTNGYRNWKEEQESKYQKSRYEVNTNKFHAGTYGKATNEDMKSAWESERATWETSKADGAEAKMWNDMLKAVEDDKDIKGIWKPILKTLILFMRGNSTQIINKTL